MPLSIAELERQVQQLQQQNRNLQQWKDESMAVWKPILDFMLYEATDLQPGDRIAEKVLAILKSHYNK